VWTRGVVIQPGHQPVQTLRLLSPAAFAIPARFGDVAISLTAPFFVRTTGGRGLGRFRRPFIAWQFHGVLDLAVAVGTGAMLRAFPGVTGSLADVEHMVAMS
jgi:hypothetical protein